MDVDAIIAYANSLPNKPEDAKKKQMVRTILQDKLRPFVVENETKSGLCTL